MAQVYKALKDFEINGEKVTAGEEIVLTTRDGENHSKEGNVILSDRELDLNDPKDIALDAAANKRKEKKEKDSADAEESRQSEVDAREAERDGVRSKKLENLQALHTQKYGEPAPVHYEALTEEEADAAIKDLEALPDYVAPENSGETAPTEPAKPERRRTAR